MSDVLLMAPAAGMLLGAVYFGGLWWSVQRAMTSKRPLRWFIVSPLLRLGVALPGFYFVSGLGWQRMLACLAGFILARIIVIRLTAIPGETVHASEH